MTNNIVNLFGRRGPVIVNANPYDGSCPHCGDADGMLNVGPDHWVVCRAHKTKWRIGSNLYSSWREDRNATRFSCLKASPPVTTRHRCHRSSPSVIVRHHSPPPDPPLSTSDAGDA